MRSWESVRPPTGAARPPEGRSRCQGHELAENRCTPDQRDPLHRRLERPRHCNNGEQLCGAPPYPDVLQAMLREHISLAKELAAQIEAEPDFERTTPANLALLTFRYRPPDQDEQALDALDERLPHALNDDRRLYLTQTRARGRYVIRFALGQRTTTRDHVQAAWRERGRV